MDFLLNPNVAYVILLAGLVLAFFSATTPGTGVGEVAALFCLVLAGYAAYQLSIHWWAIVLLGLSIPPFVMAVRSPSRWIFYLSGCVVFLASGSVFLFASEDGWISVDPTLAIVMSAFLTVVMWAVLRQFVEVVSRRPAHDLEGLIGEQGTTASDVWREGSVQVHGELWSAHSEVKIPSGRVVRVLAREGFVLLVEEVSSINKLKE